MTFMQHLIDYFTGFGSASCTRLSSQRPGLDVYLHVLHKTTMLKSGVARVRMTGGVECGGVMSL